MDRIHQHHLAIFAWQPVTHFILKNITARASQDRCSPPKPAHKPSCSAGSTSHNGWPGAAALLQSLSAGHSDSSSMQNSSQFACWDVLAFKIIVTVTEYLFQGFKILFVVFYFEARSSPEAILDRI